MIYEVITGQLWYIKLLNFCFSTMPVGEQRKGAHDRGRHGHDHASTKRPSSSASHRKGSVTSVQKDKAKSAKSVEPERHETKSPDELDVRSLTDDSTPVKDEELTYPNGQISTENENTTDEIEPREPEPEPEKPEMWAEKSTDEYKIRSFDDNILEYTEIFDNDKFKTIHSEYPVDDLISAVNSVSGAIDEFKQQSLASQIKLEGLREKMKEVKEAIHHNIAKNAVQLPGKSSSYIIHLCIKLTWILLCKRDSPVGRASSL